MRDILQSCYLRSNVAHKHLARTALKPNCNGKFKNLIENYTLRTRNVLKTFFIKKMYFIFILLFYEELNKVKELCAHMDIFVKEMRSKPIL